MSRRFWRMAATMVCWGCAAGPHGTSPTQRLPIAAAVPRQSTGALLIDAPWSHIATWRGLAARLGAEKEAGTALVGLSALAGFDLSLSAEWAAHGFDPDGGLALFMTRPTGEPVLAIAETDPALAERTLRAAFERYAMVQKQLKPEWNKVRGPSGEVIQVSLRPEGQLGMASHGGFLYLRPLEASDPVPQLAELLRLTKPQTLAADDDFLDLSEETNGKDLSFHVSGPEMEKLSLRQAMLGVSVAADRFELEFAGLRKNPAQAPAAEGPPQHGDLAAAFPPGALAWAHLSGAPDRFWQLLRPSLPANMQKAGEFFPADANLSLITGHFAAGIYAEHGSPSMLVAVELTPGRAGAMESALDRAIDNLVQRTSAPFERYTSGGAPVWRVKDGSMVAAIAGERLFIELRSPSGPAGRDDRGIHWPLEAGSGRLGLLFDVLHPGPRTLRDELGPAPSPVRASTVLDGGILDLAGLLDLAVRFMPDHRAQLQTAVQFVRAHAGFSPILLQWSERGPQTSGRLWAVAQPPGAMPRNRLRDELERARAHAAVRPDDAHAHLELADLLLRAGAGEAARKEARRAEALDPSPFAERELAKTLESDLYGRRWRAGFDAAGAEAALRKAHLADANASVELALLLERDANGTFGGPGARTADAAAELRAMRTKADVHQLDENLFYAELHAGMWDEILADAAGAPAERTEAFALAAVAVRRGVDAALVRARDIPDDRRVAALLSAAGLLKFERQYPLAIELLDKGESVVSVWTRLADERERVRLFRKYEEVKVDANDPGWVVRQAVAAACDPAMPAAGLTAFFAAGAAPERGVRAELLPVPLARWAEWLDGGLDALRCRDWVYSLRATAEGDAATGWKVELFPGRMTSQENGSDLWWLVAEKGPPRILCHGTCGAKLAARALALFDANDDASGRQVLIWSSAAFGKNGPLPEFLPMFKSLSESQPSLAAAAGSVWGATAPRALELLAKGAESLPAGPNRDALRIMLGEAHLASKHPEDGLRAVDGLELPGAKSIRLAALDRLHRAPEADALADQWASSGDALGLWRAFSHWAPSGDLRKIDPLGRKLIAANHSAAAVRNSLAWANFCTGAVGADVQELAEKAAADGRSATLNTLAAVLAEAGRTDDARRAFVKLIDTGVDAPMSIADRYVQARIFEGYRLDDLAAEQYRQVLEGGATATSNACVVPLARTHLAGLR